MDTMHYKNDKNCDVRREIIKKYIGYGNEVFRAEVDRGHKNGSEIHVVTDSGIIEIYNTRTKKHITDLIARPNQIKRVYNAKNEFAPKWLLDIAKDNMDKGYNLV